uniref:3'-5' exonuclease domain-containing protein n=1 Tax=Hyaloperonospora arabidopsidis (strain Emoy2) TaxID=559515 RepID=M4BL55_HYAAE
MEAMRTWDSGKVQTEIALAFASVAHAPSSFLQCLQLYRELPNKHVASVSHWISAAVACLQDFNSSDKSAGISRISVSDRQLAASMLPALQRSRVPFVAEFALAYQVDTEALAAFCSQLLLPKSVGTAVRFMECLKMKNLVSADVVLHQVVKQQDFRTGDVFVKGYREKQEQFVQLLIDANVHDKVIKKRLSLFKLPASAFPVYFERRQTATLRFLMHSKEYEQALQFVENLDWLKLYACKMIMRHVGPEDPATKQFIFRAGFADQFPEVDTSAEDGKQFKNQDEPTPLDSCLSLADTIGEANIVFVDTPLALQACTDYLLMQPAIGFDSEWKAVHVSTGPNDSAAKCALLQLASREKAFVVDVVALFDHGYILAPLFRSESVLKIGFDTRGDVKALRPFLTGGYAADNIMSMLVDLQTITRKLPILQWGDESEAISAADDNNDTCSKEEAPAAQNTDSGVSGAKSKQRKWQKKRSKKTGENDTVVKPSRLGLAAVAKSYLGFSLDKRVRMSNWERRPLTQAQLHYAALDAHVLVQIYYKMGEKHPADTLEAVLKRCTQKHVK